MEENTVKDFNEFMKEREEEYKERMKKLKKDLSSGDAGIVYHNGQWYLKDGSQYTPQQSSATLVPQPI